MNRNFATWFGVAVFLTFGPVTRADLLPERTVQENVITSQRDPKISVRFPATAKYVGADRWELLGIADCELHVFVEADHERNVEKLYWIQFEQYLPTKPDLHHTYDSPRHVTVGGMDFYVDTWVKQTDHNVTADSDEEHVQKLIRAKGYKLSMGMMSVRLVHLLDQQKRKELMLIYSEDVAPTGLTAADLGKEGPAHARWPQIEQGLIDRATKQMQLEY